MADQLVPNNNPSPPNQLQVLLNALSSIDRRLIRIEHALKIPPPQQQNLTTAAAAAGLSSSTAPPLLQHNQNNPNRNNPQVQQQQLTVHNPAPTAGMNGGVGNGNISSGNNNVSGGGGGTGAIIPLQAPPPGFTIASRAAMQDALDEFTLPRGYSMRIAGAKVTGKRKVRWVCFRGGEARHHRPPLDPEVFIKAKEEGRRKPTTDRTSKKCGCLFKFEVIETAKDSDVWVLHYPNEEHKVHNHGPSDTASDPRARKLPPYMSTEVDSWLRQGWLVSKIQDELRAKGFTNVLNTDLYNRKRLLKKGEGGGR